ncbi:Nitrous oxide reductase maturation protein NosR [hydrothermal vent metagenome]|uniref:Nitrous oxide reductase maturation protein NosR n=1 Tax=hydrothermal vent metagenome TaxID=652676 RepID=A0A3B0WCJ2_9ZZZZ
MRLLLVVFIVGFSMFVSPALNAFELRDRLDLKIAYPQATTIKINPKVAKLYDAYAGNSHIGYVVINTNFSETIGYSGKPIHMAIGVDNDGVIRGIQMLKHSEPIILIGIPQAKLMKPFEKYIGYNVLKAFQQKTLDDNEIDIISGATVTVIVMDDSIISSILKAFRALSIIENKPITAQETRTIKQPEPNERQSWQQLLDNGSVQHLHLTVGEVSQIFLQKGYAKAATKVESSNPDDVFIDLYLAVVSLSEIGQNLLGEGEYKNLQGKLTKDQHAVVIAANGLFSFRGSGFVRGGVFDRFQIEQGEEKIRFRDQNYKRLRQFYAAGTPEFTEIGLFYLPIPTHARTKINITNKFVLNLLISRAVGPREKRFFNAHLPYQIPDKFVDISMPVSASLQYIPADAKEIAENRAAGLKLVQGIWDRKQSEIIILSILLFILTAIFFFQLQLTRYPKLTLIVRYSFLSFVLVWLGFMQNAQLSVVNVFTFFGSLLTNFDWHFFLRDPLVFILWCAVAGSLILWARGAYCGWLCPFGALQELTNHIARKLKIPQITMPWGLHERLWAVKYLIFLGLLGISMYSFEMAEHLAEVEPFKTSIILKFQRSWPFVVYGLSLLVIGLFIERFFCRYLCPLGAGLAIPAKLKLFDWIKRYPNDCGSPCQICANECMVQAIHPEGNINLNECINCLHCQVRYVDEQVCPVMVKKRKKRERRDNRGRPANQHTEAETPLSKLKLNIRS